MKTYTLNHLGGNRFALVNETDRDPITDYYPGIWGITSQKQAIACCREILRKGKGNEIISGIGDSFKISRVIEQI